MANPYDSLPAPVEKEAAAAAAAAPTRKRGATASASTLPAGWKRVPSRSRPGQFTYENQHTKVFFASPAGLLHPASVRHAICNRELSGFAPPTAVDGRQQERISWIPDRPAATKPGNLPPEPKRVPKPRRPSDPEEAQKQSIAKLTIVLEKIKRSVIGSMALGKDVPRRPGGRGV